MSTRRQRLVAALRDLQRARETVARLQSGPDRDDGLLFGWRSWVRRCEDEVRRLVQPPPEAAPDPLTDDLVTAALAAREPAPLLRAALDPTRQCLAERQ